MDIDKLVKGIQIIVKEEVKKTVPRVVKEAVKRETASLRKENKKLKKKINEISSKDVVYGPNGHVNGNDDYEEGTFMDENSTNQNNIPQFSSNPAINQVLAETAQNYSPNPKNVPPAEQPKQINEASGNPEDMEEYPTMNHNMRPQPNGVAMSEGGAEQVKANMRAEMEAQFQGQGGGGPSRPSPNGLGVKTGLAALDRVLNRDNSELVKKFDKSKTEPYRPGSGKSNW